MASRSSGLKIGLYKYKDSDSCGKLDPVDTATTGLLNNRNYAHMKKAYHRILKSSATALGEPHVIDLISLHYLHVCHIICRAIIQKL